MDTILVSLWAQARQQFQTHLLTRKGMNKAWMARRNTRAAYRTAVEQFLFGQDDLLRAGFTPPRPWEASSADAKAYAQALLLAGKAPATVNQRLAGLKEFYRFVADDFRLPRGPFLEQLVHTGLLWADPENPDKYVALLNPAAANPFHAGKVKRLEVKPYGRSKFPTRQEFDTILAQIDLDTVNGLRDYALLYFMVTTSRRIAEVLNIKWGDIRQQDDGQRVYDYIAKGRVEQTAVIGPQAWQAITTYLSAAGRLADIQPAHYIFVSHIAAGPRLKCNPLRPLSYSAADHLLKKYGLAAGVDRRKAHTHAIRHRALRNLRDQTAAKTGQPDLLYLRTKAGHKNVGTTEIYIDNTDETAADPYQAEAEAPHARPLPNIEGR